MSCVKSYTFPIGGASTKGLFFGSEADDVNQKYYIDVNIMSAYGEFKLVKIIADTGNDITLITKKTADALGFHPSMGTLLEVSGIREGMVSKFKKITTQIQLGDLTPATVEMAFAVDDESLAENLLGNKGLLSSGQYEYRYTDKNLTIIDRVNTCDMTMGMAQAKSVYSNDNKNVESSFWTNYRNRNNYYY